MEVGVELNYWRDCKILQSVKGRGFSSCPELYFGVEIETTMPWFQGLPQQQWNFQNFGKPVQSLFYYSCLRTDSVPATKKTNMSTWLSWLYVELLNKLCCYGRVTALHQEGALWGSLWNWPFAFNSPFICFFQASLLLTRRDAQSINSKPKRFTG